jgi:hypothetical protein
VQPFHDKLFELGVTDVAVYANGARFGARKETGCISEANARGLRGASLLVVPDWMTLGFGTHALGEK